MSTKMYTSNQLRKIFINYFTDRNHTHVPSSPLVPRDDPTLLFTSAGMVQFKPLFRGDVPLPYKRAVSIQKCLRGSDIEEVKITGRHHTFFEMLGNFSFGDYFKEDAIKYAWEFITTVLSIDDDRLYISVHNSDEESYNIWKDVIGIPTKKIMRFGDEDNFWGPAGGSGPCGPCTEILYDKSGDKIEVWNIVFPQYNQDEDGKRKPLKNRGVDTGMGLERLAMVCQEKETTYGTDLFRPIIEETERLLSSRYQDSRESFHLIADHIRAIVFAVSEGVYPSNETRGYFVRKLLRRALLEGNRFNINRPFLYNLVPVVADIMKEPYHEILDKRETIALIVKNEEERFLETLKDGIIELERMMRKSGGKKLPSNQVYRLYDTYGFPPELAQELAEERGYNINLEEINDIARKEKEKVRDYSRFKLGEKGRWDDYIKIERDTFVGYDTLSCDTEIARSRRDKENIELILVTTPFYAESGGQVGDTGIIHSERFDIEVVDTKLEAGFHIHIGRIKRIEEGADIRGKVHAQVDIEGRRLIEANHTATHLLQAALRRILGDHVHQEGSWVGKDKLRFDFTHFSALSEKDIIRVEDTINTWIVQGLPVTARNTSLDKALRSGAIALFGEKYEESVRMIEIGEISRELCGGTHVRNTSQIGIFKILSESGVHTGIRRIEALTSMGVRDYLSNYVSMVGEVKGILGSQDVLVGLKRLLKENEELKERIRELQKNVLEGSKSLEDRLKRKKVSGIEVITGYLPGLNVEDLRQLSDRIRSIPKRVCAIATTERDKPLFIVSVSDDLRNRLHAGKIAALLGMTAGGGGGGKSHLAEAGGKSDVDLDKVLSRFRDIVTDFIRKK